MSKVRYSSKLSRSRITHLVGQIDEVQKQMAKDGYKLPSESSFFDCRACGLRERGEVVEWGWVEEWKRGLEMEDDGEELMGGDV